MITSGTSPISSDDRDYSYGLSFGAVATFPDAFSVDRGLTNRDQNADGWPFSCTGQTTADIATDQDGLIYDPIFTYKKTCYMEGHDPNQGCQIRNSIKSARIYGMKPEHVDESDAINHKRGAYFNVYDDHGLDFFDTVRSAILTNKRGVSIGTPFFGSWNYAPNGIAQDFEYDGNPNHYSWHNMAVKGWKTLNGIPYLMLKVWLGPSFGDNGFLLIDREKFNRLMAINGAAAFTFAAYKPEDAQSIGLDLWEYVLVYLSRLIGLSRYAR